MNKILIYCYFISSILLGLNAQVQDTIVNTKRLNNTYGLRIGLDLNKLVTTATNSNYKGFEIIGDYRLTQKWYLSGEIGNEERTISEDAINSTTKGNFIRLGADYNAYKNLAGIRNLIFVGLRYGFSNFDQRLNSFNIIQQDSFFDNPQRISNLSNKGLNAHWLEFVAGVKAEVLNNIFIGFTLSVKRNISDDKPKGFDNFFIPGFGKTNDASEFGAGFSYHISYYLPLYKKRKKADKKPKENKTIEKPTSSKS